MARSASRRRARPMRPRLALLVGLTPMMTRALEGPLALRMDVAAVAFPGDAFEAAAAELQPCLVVVDVTYLDEARVRPLMIDRFSRKGPVLVFVSESGRAWSDDLDSGCSGPMETFTVAAPAGAGGATGADAGVGSPGLTGGRGEVFSPHASAKPRIAS